MFVSSFKAASSTVYGMIDQADDVVSDIYRRIKLSFASALQDQRITEAKTGLQQTIENINQDDLKAEGNNVHFANLAEQLKTLAKTACQHGNIDDIHKVIEYASALLPTGIQKEDDAKATLQKAKRLTGVAKEYLDAVNEKKLSDKVRILLRDVSNGLLNLIDTLQDAFGLADIFLPSDRNDKEEGHEKSHRIEALITILAALVAVLAPVISSTPSVGYLIAGVLLSLVALSLIYSKFLRPTPASLGCESENWTLLLTEEKKDVSNESINLTEAKRYVSKVRLEERNKMAERLISREPVLITGESGVGKTDFVKNFVLALETTDAYPELKGKTVFYFNTANLIRHHTDHTGPLEQINKILRDGNHRNDVILVFDEIHNAYDEKNKEGEKLLSKLGGAEENFPYVIGITTEEQYKKHIATKDATTRRFDGGHIMLESLDAIDTKLVLNELVLHYGHKTFVSEENIKYLTQVAFQLFPDDPQPLGAIQLLSACLKKTGASQQTIQEIKLAEKLFKKASIEISNAVLSETELSEKDATKLEKLNTKIEELQKVVDTQAKEKARLEELRQNYTEIKTQMMKTALEIKNVSNENITASMREINTYHFIHQHLLPAMKKNINDNAKCSTENENEKIELNVEITENLINQVISEEQERRAKIAEYKLQFGDENNYNKDNNDNNNEDHSCDH